MPPALQNGNFAARPHLQRAPGWRAAVRLLCCCTLLFTISAPQLVPPVLFGKIAIGLGATQAHVTALVPASYALGMLLFSIPGSLFMERFGVHKSFMMGISIHCILFSAQVGSSCIEMFVLLQFLIGCCSGFSFQAAFVAFCNAWFGERPSTAIAIVFSSFGVAGTVWSLVAAHVATGFGWRASLALAAGAQWCVALPLAVFAMRDPPASAAPRIPSPVARKPSMKEDASGPWWWVTDVSVWLLALLTFSVLYATYSINNNVTNFFKDEAGVTLEKASHFTSLIFACNFFGKLASGPLYDSKHASKFVVAGCVLLLFGCCVFLFLSFEPTAGRKAFVCSILFGLGYGMTYSLIQSKAALHFGHRKGFKALQGFMVCWQAAGQIAGEIVTPELAQAASYRASFTIVAVFAAIAVVAMIAFEVREASFDAKNTTPLKTALISHA